jgi:protein-tyrosine phosphatase
LDEILPELYVGPCPLRADDVARLKQEVGASAVLNLQTDEDIASWRIDWPALEAQYRRSGIELQRVPIRDFDAEDLRNRLPASVQALDELLRKGHRAYVHCTGGINRSPSTVVAYLHWVLGWDLDRAVNHVKQRHPCDPYVDAIRLASEDREK